MRYILTSLILLALTGLSAARAQSTNVTNIRVTITTNGVTDNINITPTAREVEGFLLQYRKQVMVAAQATNAEPTIQQAIRATVNTGLLRPLAVQASADERKQQKVEAFVPLIPALWDDLTVAERNALNQLATKYATNAPAN